MTQDQARSLGRPATQALLGGIAIVVLTHVCERLGLDVATTAMVDLIVVVLLSLSGNFAASAIIAVIAAVSLHYYVIEPRKTWGIPTPLDLVVLGAFLFTALVITRLLSRVRISLEQAETARRELRTAIDTIPALVWTTLPDGTGELNNARWLEFTGLAADQAEGWGYTSALHPEDYQRLLPKWTASFRSGEPIEDEARLRRADGTYRWFLHRAVPLRDSRGAIARWYGTSIDIEERQRARELLRERASLLDLTHDTIFVRDLNDVITYWNRGAEDQYGWSREEAVGRVSHQIMETVFPAPLEGITSTLFSTGRWEGELIHTTRDGRRMVVASRWSLQRDEEGRPIAILETNNDITERKRAEDELRRSEAYLAEAQRLSHTGSWARNLRHPELSYRSPETYRIFGLEAPEGGHLSDLEFERMVFPEDLSKLEQVRQAAIRDKTDYETEFRVTRSDGSIRHVYILSHSVLDSTGEVVELVGTMMDVTERKQAERALRRARERVLKARFDAALDERTRLAREIHDTLLQGFTGIALKLVAATNRLTGPPEMIVALRDVVDLAQKTLVDARQAVWDLRTHSSAGADFTAALRTAAEDCVRGTGLTLEYEVAGDPRPLDPDIEGASVRVVQEAITNVVKHATASTVRLLVVFGERHVRLSVTDDGRGFDMDSNLHGFGGHWGLLGMRERASQIRGQLRVRSAPGQGTKVVLWVPYATRGGARRLSPAPTP
jgi:PAS domain S-box-containing protein